MNRILVAEDEAPLRNIIRMILRAENFIVDTVSNGLEALKALREHRDTDEQYDILITDIQMPEVTGLELIEKLHEETFPVQVLAITGFGDKSMIIDLMKMGCSRYIDKPFADDELLKTVNEMVQEIQKTENREKSLIHKYEMRYKTLQEQVESAKKSYDSFVEKDFTHIPATVKVMNRPKADLGGDFYAIKKVDNGVVMLVADVSGHDMGATYYSILLKTFFDEFCNHIDQDFESFFSLLNAAMVESKYSRMITAQLVYWDYESHLLHFQNAGHPPAFHISARDGSVRKMYQDMHVLGVMPDITYESITSPFEDDDKFVFYTDGVPDLSRIDGATGRKQLFGIDTIEKTIIRYAMQPVGNIVTSLWDEALSFARNKSQDDILLVGIQVGEEDV